MKAVNRIEHEMAFLDALTDSSLEGKDGAALGSAMERLWTVSDQEKGRNILFTWKNMLIPQKHWPINKFLRRSKKDGWTPVLYHLQ